MFIIDYLTEEDVDNAVALEHKVFTLPWSHKSLYNDIVNNNLSIYIKAIAIVDGKEIFAGFTGVWLSGFEGHITNIAVDPNFRNQNVASMMLLQLEKLLKQKGVTALTLEVRKSNFKAINLYKKAGYVQEGIRKEYYSDNNEDAIIMWKHFE